MISVALGCLLGVPALQAQYSLSELILEELMDIEVTLSTRQPEKVSSSAAAVTVVTRDELLRAGVRTLPDALRLVPGMLVGQIDGGKWIVTSRDFAGLFANKLLVLIDGRSVYTTLFSGVFWESQDVPMEDIERIEVIRGPGGTLWGANAVNGIINIVTRRAEESIGTYAEVGAGTDRRYAGVRHGVAVGGGWVRGYVKHSERARSAAASTAPVRDDGHVTRAGFRADFDLGTEDGVVLIGNAFRGIVGESLTYVEGPELPQTQRFYFDGEVAGGDLLAWGRRSWGATTRPNCRCTTMCTTDRSGS